MADAKKKARTNVTRQNVLESLKDLGGAGSAQMGDFLKNTSEDFFKELVGIPTQNKKVSGEISAGESLEMSEVLSGQAEETRRLKHQIVLERNLVAEEKRISEEKMGKLRVELQAIASEIVKLAASTQELARETEIAMIEVPGNPGIYHIIFFEKLLEFISSFRKKIEDTTLWLGSANKRAEKKGYWSMYKKKGSSFLLSPDHYLQRSAG